MARRRLRVSLRSLASGDSFLSSTPARSARVWRAPRLSVFSISSTKVKTSPWRWQPKQYQDCLSGWTVKLGVSSWWKGHSPTKSLFFLVRRTCSCTILTRSSFALTSAKASSDEEVGTGTIVGRRTVVGEEEDGTPVGAPDQTWTGPCFRRVVRAGVH